MKSVLYRACTGPDVDAVAALFDKISLEEHPLAAHYAVVADQPGVLDLLCRRGANLRHFEHGVDALGMALFMGYDRCVGVLLANGRRLRSARIEQFPTMFRPPLSESACVEMVACHSIEIPQRYINMEGSLLKLRASVVAFLSIKRYKRRADWAGIDRLLIAEIARMVWETRYAVLK